MQHVEPREAGTDDHGIDLPHSTSPDVRDSSGHRHLSMADSANALWSRRRKKSTEWYGDV
jgi:hypothetical protein